MLRLRNWWGRAFGRGRAWDEGRDTALVNAAILAYNMGRPDIRQAINRLIPDGSPYIPLDDPRHPRHETDQRFLADLVRRGAGHSLGGA